MIRDKKRGIVFAENKEEAAWYNVAEGLKNEIKILKSRNKRAEEDLKLSARKIEQRFKKGARSAIQANNESISIQKEFLKLAESKIKK